MTDNLRERLQVGLGGTIRIDRELGGGGMSRVFLATDTTLGRQIVIKTLPPELSSTAGLDRFQREIEVAARFQHPHIVSLIAAGVLDDGPYYTMPFVEGESLRDRLTRDGKLPVADTIQILREVADALSYAHARNVVHRDIKPENILIANRHALVTDFGIAKAFVAAGARANDQPGGSITQFGVTVGTPAYMAPEQVSADPTVDHRADLYALGMVGYEMLVGSAPFDHLTPSMMLAAHIATPPPAIHLSRSDAPTPLVELLAQCMAKDPDHRPQTAAAMIAALETIDAETRFRRSRRRVPVAAIVAAIVGMVLLVGAFALPPRVRVMVRRIVSRSPAVLRPNVVFVAPYDNQTGDSSVRHIADYAAGQVADVLSRMQSLSVIDQHSAYLTDQVDKAIPFLSWFRSTDRVSADQAGASIVIGGSIYADKDRLTFHTRITDYATRKLYKGIPDVVGPRDSAQAMVAQLAQSVRAVMAQNQDTTVAAALGTYTNPPSVIAYAELLDGLKAYVTFDSSFATHYRKSAAQDARYPTPLVLLALAATFRDRPALAESTLQRVTPLRDSMTAAERGLVDHVRAYLDANPGAIHKTAQDLLRLVPESMELPLLVAGAELSVGDPSSSIAALNRLAPDRGLNLVTSYYWRSGGEARHQRHEHAKALQVFREGLDRYPWDTRLAEWEATELVDLNKDADLDRSIERGDSASNRLSIAAGAVDALIAAGRDTSARSVAIRWLDRLESCRTDSRRSVRYDLARLEAAARRWANVGPTLAPILSGARDRVFDDALTLTAIAAIHAGDTKTVQRADSVLGASTDRYDYGRAQVHRAELAAQSGDTKRAEALLETAMKKGLGLQYTTWPIERDPYLIAFRGSPWFDGVATKNRFARLPRLSPSG